MKTLLKLSPITVLTVFLSLTGLIGSQAQAKDYWISMTADGFDPAYLEVTLGDKVYWVNEDYDYFDSHSTHCDTYAWNSGPVPVG